MIQAFIPLISKGLDLLFPDKSEADKHKARLAELAMSGELEVLRTEGKLLEAQIQVNMQEAQHGDVFIAGWRPFIGWVCGSAFAWNFLLRDFTVILAQAMGAELDVPPALDLSEMMPVLLGMLGLAGFRTTEKLRGVARKRLIPPNG